MVMLVMLMMIELLTLVVLIWYCDTVGYVGDVGHVGHVGAAHSESELLVNTSMFVYLLISVFVVASKDCGTGNGLVW
jgi:hypothetical protein